MKRVVGVCKCQPDYNYALDCSIFGCKYHLKAPQHTAKLYYIDPYMRQDIFFEDHYFNPKNYEIKNRLSITLNEIHDSIIR